MLASACLLDWSVDLSSTQRKERSHPQTKKTFLVVVAVIIIIPCIYTNWTVALSLSVCVCVCVLHFEWRSLPPSSKSCLLTDMVEALGMHQVVVCEVCVWKWEGLRWATTDGSWAMSMWAHRQRKKEALWREGEREREQRVDLLCVRQFFPQWQSGLEVTDMGRSSFGMFCLKGTTNKQMTSFNVRRDRDRGPWQIYSNMCCWFNKTNKMWRELWITEEYETLTCTTWQQRRTRVWHKTSNRKAVRLQPFWCRHRLFQVAGVNKKKAVKCC